MAANALLRPCLLLHPTQVGGDGHACAMIVVALLSALLWFSDCVPCRPLLAVAAEHLPASLQAKLSPRTAAGSRLTPRQQRETLALYLLAQSPSYRLGHYEYSNSG
jgi:hypothetical protein